MRQPAVAHRFYPGNPAELKRTVTALLPDESVDKKTAIAVVAPHAGYVYSGAMAGRTIGSVHIPKTVIILGPNHHGRGAAVAVSTSAWQMPNGVVEPNLALAEKIIAASPLIQEDEAAHQAEHSLEVQVPFLQALQPDLHLVPIAVSSMSYENCLLVAGAIASAIKESAEDVLLLASTDMSHYESRAAASKKDRRALERLLAMDPEGLYRTVIGERISMCGVIPVSIVLQAAKELGASEAELIGYTDSGAVSGDTDQVVGYAGLVIR
jgi:AmmeMemoRadiSam system protein B